MPAISFLADCIGSAALEAESAASSPLRRKLAELAEQARTAASATLCMIAWQAGGAPRLVRAPSYDHRNQALSSAALALLAAEISAAGERPRASFRFPISSPEAREPAPAAEVRALARAEESCAAIAIVIAAGRAGGQVDAILELLTAAVLALIAGNEAGSSRDFWKQRFEQATDKMAQLKREVQTLEHEAKRRRALVQDLALRLYDAIDAERARIARDLHDDLAQIVAATQIALAGRREKARAILREIQNRVRRRIETLRPPALGRTSLRGAIARELESLAAAGIEGKIAAFKPPRRLPRSIGNVCYLVAREALSNVIRHARAGHVEVSLRHDGEVVRLSIADDGRGIARSGKSDGVGLRGLGERVELLGGTLKLKSRPGRTELIAEIPVAGR